MSDLRLDDHPDLLSVATSIAQGDHVDWAAAEQTTTDIKLLDELKVLDHLSRFTDKVPDSWGGLSITGELGRGSHGTVYRAHDPNLGIDVALKIVQPRGASAQALAATALNEARLLAQVTHPNVVRIYWAEPEGEDIGIAMELVQGRTLRERLRQQGPFSQRETSLIGVDLCRALAAVHRARLVHGDIKAGNVMLGPGDRTVLMDFGVGKDLKRQDSTMQGRAGTPLYQAPELFGGVDPSPLSDIYSVGVLLFHMVTDTYPIDAQDAAEVERHHAEHRPRRLLRDLRPDLDAAFVKVVERAIARRPEDRYRSAGELEAALDASLQRQPPIPTPPAPWPYILATAAALIVGVMTYAVWPGPGTAVPPSAGVVAPTDARPATPPTSASSDYRIEAAFYRHEAGRDVRLPQGARVAEDDALSLQIESSVPVYAYVVNEDDQGESYLLFPLADQELTNPLPPGTRHEIPGRVGGERVRWRVSSAGGREHFLVFVSPEPPSPAFQRMFASFPRPSFGTPVLAQPLDTELVGVLRGVGGLVKAPASAATGPSLANQYGTPLPDAQETTRGWWVRQLTLENPGRR